MNTKQLAEQSLSIATDLEAINPSATVARLLREIAPALDRLARIEAAPSMMGPIADRYEARQRAIAELDATNAFASARKIDNKLHQDIGDLLDALKAQTANIAPMIEQAREEVARANAERDAARKRADDAHDKLLRIAALYNGWGNKSVKQGPPYSQGALNDIGKVLGDPFVFEDEDPHAAVKVEAPLPAWRVELERLYTRALQLKLNGGHDLPVSELRVFEQLKALDALRVVVESGKGEAVVPESVAQHLKIDGDPELRGSAGTYARRMADAWVLTSESQFKWAHESESTARLLGAIDKAGAESVK
jgi:hypothetical protein